MEFDAVLGARPTQIVEVLGPCRVRDADGGDIDLSVLQRRILCRLALAAPGSARVDELIDAVWGDDAPSTARASVQNQISRIRGRLGADVITTDNDRYTLGLHTDRVLVTEALLDAESALACGDPTTAYSCADAVLGCWRGEPFEDLVDRTEFDAERRRFDEVRLGAERIRAAAAIELGRFGWAVQEAERMVAAQPLDESRWALLVNALDGSGRRGDALGALERARRILVEELGLEPGPVLRAAEAAVLGMPEPTSPQRRIGHVGRGAALDTVAEWATAGEITLVSGESGMGKSAFLGELARRLRQRGVRVATSRCIEHPDAAASNLAELISELGGHLVAGVDPLWSFESALSRLVGDTPIVLLVDDAHLAGPTTRAALHSVGAVPGVGVVATGLHFDIRDDDSFRRFVLPPLEHDEIAVIVAERHGEPLDSSSPLVLWAAEMSGGNPLLIEYVLAHGPTVDGPTSLVAAPVSAPGADASVELQRAVQQRLSALGRNDRATLEVAAVCGMDFPIELLGSLCGDDAVRSALGTTLLVPSDRVPARDLKFRHGAIRAVLYASMTPGRREEVHLAAVSHLRRLDVASSAIAAHALAAAALAPLDAARALRDAAHESTAQGAHHDSAEWHRRGVDVAQAVQAGTIELAPTARAEFERLEVSARIGVGDALRMAGSPDQETAMIAAAEVALDYGDEALIADAAFALLQLGATTESGAHHERAVELGEQSLACLTQPQHRARVAGAASLAHSMTGRMEQCRSLFDEAERNAVTPEVRRAVLPFAYLALGHPRDLDHRERVCSELVALGTEADDPVALFEAFQLQYSVAVQRGDGVALRDSVDRQDALVERVGDVGRRWAVQYQRAAIAHLDGDLDAAEALAGEALATFAGVSPSRAIAAYSAQLLALRWAQGRLVELVDPVQELVHDQPGVPAWHGALALCLAELDPGRAATHARRALEDAPQDFTWLAAHVVGARAAALVGDSATVEGYLERLEPWSGLSCWQGTCCYGPVDLVIAMLRAAGGDESGARVAADRAAAQAERLGAPVYVAELQRWHHRVGL